MSKPLMSWNQRGVSVAVWPGFKGGYSYTMQKRYMKKEPGADSGVWTESKTLFKTDVEALILMLQEALNWTHSRAENKGEMASIPAPTQKGVASQVSFEDDDINW